jgi:hypothetical protein
MAKISHLKLTNTFSVDAPSRPLGEAGMSLWTRILSECVLDEPASLELLQIAAEASQTASDCREAIQLDGVVARNDGGISRAHPLLAHMLAAAKLASSTLQALGLAVEPIKGMGRPTSPKVGMSR